MQENVLMGLFGARSGMRQSTARWRYIRVVLLSGILATGGLVSSRTAGLPEWATWVLAGLGLLGPLVVEPMLARADRTVGGEQTLRSIAPEADGFKLPRVRDLQLSAVRIHPSRVPVPYIERDAAAQVRVQLGTRRRVLVVGPAMEGKTRLSFEVTRSLFPKRRFWRPSDGLALKETVRSGFRLTHTVIWLDDLERFLGPDGVTPMILDRLLSETNYVVATMRSQEMLRHLPTKESNPADRDVLGWFGTSVHLSGWSAEEISEVESRMGADVRSGSQQFGLGQFLAGGPQIAEHLALGKSTNTMGYTIVTAVAQWRRIGAGKLPKRAVRSAVEAIEGEVPAENDIREGLHWAGLKLNETVSIVEVGSELVINDAALDHFDRLSLTVPDALWNLAMEQVDSDQLLEMGATAYETHHREDIAEAALRASEHPLAPIYLARIWIDADPAHWDRAEELLRRAEPDEEGLRDTQLAILLEKRLGGPHAYSEEAERLYQAAAVAGNAVGTFNAGVCALRRDCADLVTAQRHFESARALGHYRASGELGRMLMARGEIDAAGELLREAAAAGYPADHASYGRWLIDRGDTDAGVEQLRIAADAEDPEGLAHLAECLANRGRRGDMAEAESLARRLSDRTGDVELLGQILMADGRGGEAESLFRSRLDDGDLDYAIALADLLVRRSIFQSDLPARVECETILRDAASRGHTASAAMLGTLKHQEWDDPDEAERWLREAADGGDTGAKLQLSDLLLARGDLADLSEARSLLEALAGVTNAEVRMVAKNNLGLILEHQGEFASAEELFMEGALAGRGPAMINVARMRRRRGGTGWIAAIPWESRGRLARRKQVPRRHRSRPKDSGSFVMPFRHDPAEFEVWLPEAAYVDSIQVDNNDG